MIGLEPSPRNPNFCLGRNVGGTGFYYTKFYLTSLVVFKEFLSDSLIYPVYLYYRINGKLMGCSIGGLEDTNFFTSSRLFKYISVFHSACTTK